jgi:hypothetical protein
MGRLCTRKLARLVYFMHIRGQAFVKAVPDEYEERCRQRVVQNLTRQASNWAFNLHHRKPLQHEVQLSISQDC